MTDKELRKLTRQDILELLLEIEEENEALREEMKALQARLDDRELTLTRAGSIAEAALALFEAFGSLLTENISHISGIFINLSESENTVCKLTMENLRTSLSDGELKALSKIGVGTACVREDDVTYITFILPERGKSV